MLGGAGLGAPHFMARTIPYLARGLPSFRPERPYGRVSQATTRDLGHKKFMGGFIRDEAAAAGDGFGNE